MLSYFPSESLANSRPSKHAGSDTGVFWFHYGQHVARLCGDCTCQIQLPVSDSVLFFQRWPGSHCVKPAQIQSGWPGQVLAKCIWSGSKPLCKNHRAWFWQNTNSLLPVSHFQTQLHYSIDCPDHTVQNQPGSDLILADCVRFWPTDLVQEQVRVQGSSGPLN